MKQAVQKHRRRLAESGFRRVEVSLPAADADLIRRVARALVSGDDQAERLRLAIERAVPAKSNITFKEWLAALPDDEGKPQEN